MNYQQASEQLAKLREDMAKLRAEMHTVREGAEAQDVADYRFERAGGGAARLADLFGDKDQLFLIHNMGAGCSYCTLWADGFNGVYDHLANKAAFVLASPDAPRAQANFAAKRGWKFPMVSYEGTSFAEDMGYAEAGGYRPGVSVFVKRNGAIRRVADERFGPGDDFCIVWPFLDLLPGGAGGWSPKFSY